MTRADGTTVKTSLILSTRDRWRVRRFCDRRSAAVRHWMLAAALISARLPLPVIGRLSPAWTLPRAVVRQPWLRILPAATVTFQPTLATVSDTVRSEAMAEHAVTRPRSPAVVWLSVRLCRSGLLCASVWSRLTGIGARG